MSKRPGIGSNYLQTHTKWHRVDSKLYTDVHGQKGRLPRYYKDKIFTQVERARLAEHSRYEAAAEDQVVLEKLSRFHDDPYAYWDERINNDYSKIFSKVNSQDLF